MTLSAITGSKFNPNCKKHAMFDSEIPEGKSVASGDFLICRGNGNKNLVGRGVRVLESMEDVAFPDTVIAVTVNENIVRTEFLELYWKLPEVRSQIEKLARTTNGTFKINQKSIETVSMKIPNLEEQDNFCNYIRSARRIQEKIKINDDLWGELIISLQSRAFRGEL